VSAVITAERLRADIERWGLPAGGSHGLSQRAVARAMEMSRPFGGPNLTQWELCVGFLSDAFAVDNPYFNRKRFREACLR
jgi:hypothetical protein